MVFHRVPRLMLSVGLFLPLAGISMAGSILKNDEHVMFLPDIAYEQPDGSLHTGIQAWVYEKERRPGLTRMLAVFLGIDLRDLTDGQRRQLYQRTQLFRVDNERGKQLFVRDATGVSHKLPKTKANGRACKMISWHPAEPLGNAVQKLVFTLDNIADQTKIDKAIAFYAPRTGLSIISDIDDTIKVSSVGNTRRLLINTFLEDFTAVEHMSTWYRDMGATGNVAFHYVSSSPIQLYPALADFMRTEGYPEGSIHLREATHWFDVIPLSNASKRHKVDSIERLLKAYPEREFILIGDSGEQDPAIYADFMRQYPQQIRFICIRDVTPDIDTSTYDEIFAGLDRTRWKVSSSIEEMRALIKNQ